MEEGPEQGLFARLKSLIRKRSHLDNFTDLEEEIHDLMDEGQAKGLVSREQSGMVFRVLDLKETQAHSIMIPRTEISTAPLEATLGEVIQLVRECGHTRIPIHKESLDQIIGILHAKDLLKLWGEGPSSQIPMEILRKPYFVPESQRIGELLRDLKEKKTHLAIVTDEYGGTSGIITIEDILEEIVGDILDEHDTEESLLSVLDDQTILVDARLEIKKLEEYLGLEFPEGAFDSVGGFIINLMGKIPEIDEKVVYGDLEMIIQKADRRKIDKILVRRLPRASASVEETDTRP